MNLVSVIVPIYNAEAYLQTCLLSILNQSYTNLEIILIDDGSTDRSGAIARMFAKQYENIMLIQQENYGPSVARNRGIAIANGAYLQFVDADDRLNKDSTKQLVAAIHTGADLVICGFETINKQFAIPIPEKTYYQNAFLNQIGNLYKSTLLASPCNKLYRKQIIQDHNIQFQPGFSYGEDLVFNLHYIQKVNTVYMVDGLLYWYRKHSNSITNSYIPNLFAKHKQIYTTFQEFLKSEQADTIENVNALHYVFAEQSLYAISNLFLLHHRRKIIAKLKIIMEDAEVQKCVPYLKTNFQGTLYYLCIRYKATYLTYLLFKLKGLVKEVIR